MCRRLIYLVSFVLVLALVSTDVAFGQFVWEGRISKDSDDTEELDPSGAPEGSSGDLEMPYEDAGMGDKQLVGLRWEDVYVPKGARIVEAWLEFTVDETGEGSTFVSVIIEGELNPNPPTFTTTTPSEIADRQPRTTAKAIWEPEPWLAVGEAHQTSDISPVIEEIVNQDGWVAGNALVLIIRDNPANPSQGKRVADAGGGDAGVLLHIEYVTAFPEASKPSPDDGAIDVPRDVVLSWTPGDYVPPVNGHKVYLSESFDDVNAGIGGVTHSADSYAPAPRLDFNKTYYWRVDEVNGPPDYTVYEGSVWSFTTELFVYPIENITATASSQFSENTGPEKSIDGSGLDDNDLHSTDETSMWLSSMTGPQPTWIQYEFDRVYKLHEMWVWNLNRVIEPIVGFGLKDVNIEYSTNGTDWAVLTDVPEFAQAPGEDGYAHNTTVDLAGVPAKYVKLTANTNFGGLLPQYGLSEVRFFHIPVVAREPDPASGAADADVDGVLSWRAGREAATHKVYLSADEQAVIDETISPVSIPADRSYTNYATGELVLGQSYYWKVNEVNEAETPATWQGNVWNFSTQEYLVVDDFE
ncbi:MAG: discoidin domain-containing protein, partial [Phycisphaerae bacterium]